MNAHCASMKSRRRVNSKSRQKEMKDPWRLLPGEILESAVLPCLPLASLCRFKAVCKKWKELITHRNFNSSHARASRAEQYVVITVRCERPFDDFGSWDVLDMANDKIFTISNNFLENYVKQEQCVKGEKREILAADGGLFLVMYSFDSEDCSNRMFLVCNPVLQTAKVLPALSGWDETCNTVNMLTNRVSMEYEIMVVHGDKDVVQVTLDLYESSTGAWRRVAAKDCSSSHGMYDEASMSLKNNQLFFRVPLGGSEEAFCRKAIKMTSDENGEAIHDYLVVECEGRLFSVVVKWGGTHTTDSICIFEILLDSNESVLLEKMPEDSEEWLMGDDIMAPSDFDCIISFYTSPVVAAGCGSSLVFFSCTGRCVAFDVNTKSWRCYNDNNLSDYFEQAILHSWYINDMFCSSYCLSLCPP